MTAPAALRPAIPTLETARLVLRAPGPEDFEPYAAFAASERSRFVGGPFGRIEAWRGLAALLGHWALRGFGRWSVDAKGGARSLGFVGLHHPEGWPEPEIAWTLFADAEGRGYAREAAEAVRAHAYGALGWRRVVSLVDPENARSTALARRLGCTAEGTHRHPDHGALTIWRHPGPEAG